MSNITFGIANDLGVLWDPEATRLARVLVSEGRIEIVLCEPDPEWVAQALEDGAKEPGHIVIASPPPSKEQDT